MKYRQRSRQQLQPLKTPTPHRLRTQQYVSYFQEEDGIRDGTVTGVQTCALPISTLRIFKRTQNCSSIVMRFRKTMWRSEEHTSELQSQFHLVCRLLLEKNQLITIPLPQPPFSRRCRFPLFFSAFH